MGKLINEFELADWFGVSVLTLRRTRCCNPERHPPYKKLGSSVRYDPEEVQRWIDSKTVNGQDTPKTPSPASSPKQTHRGAPTKIERVKKARNANK